MDYSIPVRTADTSLKRLRTYKGKTKTGCGTCKIRHKKCGEEKPECVACISTGRKCDGYQIQSRPPSKGHPSWSEIEHHRYAQNFMAIGLPWEVQQVVTVPGTHIERRSLDYFCQRTAPILTGFVDSDFWSSILPQISHSEPTIWHAIIAVSSLHEHTESNPMMRLQNGSDKFALQQYIMATFHLRQRLSVSKDNQSVEITLICCILFVCLEFLRIDIQAALAHIRGGLKILASHTSNDISSSDQNQGILNSNLQSTVAEHYLLPIFHRLYIQSTLSTLNIANEKPKYEQQRLPPSTKSFNLEYLHFEDFHEARLAGDYLGSTITHFISEITPLKYETVVKPEVTKKQSEYERQMLQFFVAFEELCERSEASQKSSRDRQARFILEIHYRSLMIQLRSSTTGSEMIYDTFLSDFEKIVSLAESLDYEPNQCPSFFSFDLGIVAPLSVVGFKCRDSGLRERALKLLFMKPRQEGFWFGRWSARLAHLTYMIEQQHVQVLPNGDFFVPEWARIHQVDVDEEIIPNPARSKLRFLSKPDGLNGKWHIHTDWLIRQMVPP